MDWGENIMKSHWLRPVIPSGAWAPLRGGMEIPRRSIACALTLVLAFCGIQVAAAADLPAATPVYKAAPAGTPYDWTGFYAGGNIGYCWGSADAADTVNGVGFTFLGFFPVSFSHAIPRVSMASSAADKSAITGKFRRVGSMASKRIGRRRARKPARAIAIRMSLLVRRRSARRMKPKSHGSAPCAAALVMPGIVCLSTGPADLLMAG